MWLIVQIMTCAFMTGLIWLIQLVHYPAFEWIAKDQFNSFHQFHSARISYIVGPIMLLELISAALLFINSQDKYFFGINLGLLVVIWLCTALLSVPQHNILSSSANSIAMTQLVLTNWPRTILWSLRTALLAWFFTKNYPGSY